ncbi:MAG TPA: M20/M25/M40 family metallo-hydrolase [Chloroflexi bacterium]|nr:M20/M25/M40 family metallo-hydrolase [Chloroflexota bacterium]
MEQFYDYVDANRDRFLDQLVGLCSQPSIAAQGVGLVETAELVGQMLQGIGADVCPLEVPGAPPVVYGEIGEGRRTLIVYDHYDVQPPEPLEQWDSEPFSPEVRDGFLYCRGVADNKGDLMARLQAVEAYQAAVGPMPLKIKFVFEGEEEVGSPHLADFVEENSRLLAGADGCLWEGGRRDLSGRPELYVGLKGILYVELRCRAASRDMHSSWAPLVPNPAWRLVWALGTLKDEDERIAVDGLLDYVREPTRGELALTEKIPFEDEAIREDLGIPQFLGGAEGVQAVRQLLYAPTCTICGLVAGYTGEGSKTVLPSEARVKLDFRLVPDLEPDLVLGLLREHLDRRGFEDVEIVPFSGEHPAKSRADAPVAQAAVQAAKLVYGQDPVLYPTMAGSGPMYPLSVALGVPAVSGVGVGHAQSRIHAPNENIRVEDYFQCIKFTGEFFRIFAGM